MLYNPLIHPAALLAKGFLGRLEKMRGGLRYNTNELVVVNYHSTPRKFIGNFEKQVDFLRSHFTVIGPGDLETYYRGELRTERCALLFTFDDGLKNNLYAAEVLNRHNIKALFFVVPVFIDTPPAGQREYYLANIRPLVDARIDGQPEDLCSMTWDELRALVAQGHAIGAHTYTHTLVAQDSSAENSEKEIAGCKTKIESALQIKVNSFCSINNTLLSTGKKEKTLIEKNYRFHFTTLPGFNAGARNRLFIKRRNVECFWPDGAFYFALGKADLKRWEEKIKRYEAL